MANIILHQIGNTAVGLNSEDGFVNATAMTKGHRERTGQRKDVHNWLQSKRTKETLEHLSSVTGIPVTELYQVFQGAHHEQQGTWIHPRLAVRFAMWLSDDFGLTVENWIEEWSKGRQSPIVVNQLDQDKAKLERQLLPAPTAQDRLDALRLLKAGGHKKEYIQRISIQMAKAICPDIEAPAPTEMASLPTAKALLTPTQIAEELQLFYASGKGNAIKVNKLLSDLGYQEKIQGQWSGTEKAIAANLCDRKPVDPIAERKKISFFGLLILCQFFRSILFQKQPINSFKEQKSSAKTFWHCFLFAIFFATAHCGKPEPRACF
jgi:KilA-N domain